jgi:hypothetical protein
MARMSFRFTASGTKAETLAALTKTTVLHDPAAVSIADLLTAMVSAGPEQSSDGKPIIYEAEACGHSARGQARDDWPSINVVLSCTTGARPHDG